MPTASSTLRPFFHFGVRVQKCGTTWNQVNSITSPEGHNGDEFGISGDFAGPTLLVGARFVQIGAATNAGAVYAYEVCNPTNLPPTVQVQSPDDQAVVTLGDALTATATASDPDGHVMAVQWLLDGVATGAPVFGEPYRLTLPTADLAPGRHSLSAMATDDRCGSAIDTVSVTVRAIPTPPVLSVFADQLTLEDTATPAIAFNVSDGLTPAEDLKVIATTSDSMLLPPTGIVLGGSGKDRTITLTPAHDQFGVTTNWVVVTNTAGLRTTNQFLLKVMPVNDAPTLDAIDNVTLDEDVPLKTIALTGITTGAANEVQVLTVTAVSDKPSLIANPTVVYTSPNAAGTLAFQPLPNANGTATITVTVKDDGGTASGGLDTVTRQFTVTVNAVNDAPTLDAIGSITVNEDDSARTVDLKGITTGAANEMQVLTVTAVSDKPAIIANPTIIYTSPNAAGTLAFQPLPNANGTATITVTVKDDGGTANGGLDTVTRQFTVTVLPVNRLGQTITFDALGDKFVDDAPFLISATSSSGLPVSLGIVSGRAFFSGNTLTLTGPGTVTVRASQTGNEKYNAATPVDQSFAVRASGTVVAWGFNSDGQTTVHVGLSGVTAIAAGYLHTVALKREGTVVAWGATGFFNYRQAIVPAGLNEVTAITAGGYHTVALKRDGTVVAWGNNGQGQTTGSPTTTPPYSATANPVTLNGVILSGVTNITAGYFHTVALKRDGTVVAWGDNSFGQSTVPFGLSGVTAIAAGYYHTVALKRDGTVVAWGYNHDGQTNVPAGLSEVAAIAAGYAHTVALKRDGTVVAWGYNDSGQTNVPVGLSGVTAIAAGEYHTVALKRDGTVVAWGRNGNGQTTVPDGLSEVTAIATCGNHTVALIPSVRSVIGDVHLLVNGVFSFRSYSEPNQTVIIESSTNLNLWTPILTNKINASGYLEFTEPVDLFRAHKYYRVRLP